MMRKRKKKVKAADIPLAGMSDIAFLLIIFFMLTTVFTAEKGLQIVLPMKGEQVKVKKKNIIHVYVNKLGQVRINDRDVSLLEVREVIRKMLDENPKAVVSLKIDERCKYDDVIKVFDQLKLAKAERIAFAPPRRAK